MVICISALSTLENLFQLLLLLVVFGLLLVATYYTTKWIGKNANIQSHAKNIEVIETFRLSQNKFIQIVKAGKDRYLVIAVSKDNVEFLAELSEDELDFSVKDKVTSVSFSDVMKKVSKETINRFKNNK